MGTVRIIAALLLWIGAGCARPTKPPTTQPIPLSGVDLLRRDFKAAFGDTFEIGDDRLVVDRNKILHWLVEVRPSKAGVFTIRYDCRVPVPAGIRGDSDWGFEFLLFIGEAGTQREVVDGQYSRQIYPLACVGDTILVPIRVDPALKDHRFFSDGFYPDRTERKREFWEKEFARRERLPAEPKQQVTLENQAAKELTLLLVDGTSSVDRPLRFMHHSLGAVFEASKPSRFNVAVAPVDENPQQQFSVVIVPKGSPVTVIPPSVDTFRGDGKGRSSSSETLRTTTVMLRPGDRWALHCWDYKTPVGQNPVIHPALKLIVSPFAPDPAWPENNWVMWSQLKFF